MKPQDWVRAGAIFGACVTMIFVGNKLGLGKADWASWVQAIGALIAIGIAIYVSRQQAESAAQLVLNTEQRALVRQAEVIEVIVSTANNSIIKFAEGIEVPFNVAAIQTGLRFAKSLPEMLDAMNQIPLHSIGNWEMAQSLIQMRRAARQMCECIDIAAGNIVLPGTVLQIQMSDPIFLAQVKDAKSLSMLASGVFSHGVTKLKSSRA